MSTRNSKTRRRTTPRVPYGFDPFMALAEFDAALDGLDGDPGALHIVGNPFAGGTPTMREATLEDCVDECEMCQAMRRQILAGNPPQIMAFE